MNFTSQTITIESGRIVQAWHDLRARKPCPIDDQSALGSSVEAWLSDRKDSFTGCSGKEMDGWLRDGYYSDGDGVALPQSSEDIDVPWWEAVEDGGDMVIEAVLAGDDLPYVRWENMPMKRGLVIEAAFDFNCGTRAKTINEYTSWILDVIDQAQRMGNAPEVVFYIATEGSFNDGARGTKRIRIPLVKAGEVIDVVAWRAYLSEGGFRTLGFIALGLAAHDLGTTLTYGLGSATGTAWKVNKVGDVLHINCPSMPSDFPAESMTKQLRECDF